MIRKTFRFGQQVTVFINERMSVPSQIGRRFTRAGSRVKISSHAFGGLPGAKIFPVFGFANRDIAGRKICQNGRAGHGRIRARRYRRPYILADFRMERHSLHINCFKYQVAPEWDRVAKEIHFTAKRIPTGSKLPFFVKFAVVGQVRFRGDAEDSTAINHDRTIK